MQANLKFGTKSNMRACRNASKAYESVHISVDDENVKCRYYGVPGAQRAVLYLSAGRGGWDTPGQDLYSRLGDTLQSVGIGSLHVRYRRTKHLEACVADALAGSQFLQRQQIKQLAIIGHSFGAVVAVQAAALQPITRSVVLLGAHNKGVEPVVDLPPRCSLLVVHSIEDRVVPAACSKYVYSIAHESKRIVLYSAADHYFTGAAQALYQLVFGWLRSELSAT